MIVDAHVHLFPARLAAAVREWFRTHGWPFAHANEARAALADVTAAGADRVVALPYVHKPGMAAALNRFTRALAEEDPRVVPCCTVFPGEDGQERLLDEALAAGARGIKIHCHVMKVAPDDPRLDPVYSASARWRRPVTIHAGREPSSEGYGLDVHSISGAERMRRALERHPDAIVIVPHLGADEFDAFERLLDEFPNLYLDTTMALARFFPMQPDPGILRRRADRILFGSDYPQLPYAWSREPEIIKGLGLPREDCARIMGGNAVRVFGIE